MSVSYRTRKKAIRDYKLKHPEKLDVFGRIRKTDFAYLQANWKRELTGPPIGTLADLMEARNALAK